MVQTITLQLKIVAKKELSISGCDRPESWITPFSSQLWQTHREKTDIQL